MDDGVGEILYADDLFVGDIVWLEEHLCVIKLYCVNEDTELVYITARDIFSDAMVIPFPLHTAHLVEVWERAKCA